MRSLLSTRPNNGAFNTATFLMRIGFGLLLAHIGFLKLISFEHTRDNMIDFLHMGKTFSTVLVIFAEFFCSILVIIGLFTRFACIPILVVMTVALFMVHNGEVTGQGQTATLFLIGFLTLIITGPGRVSVDSMISK